MSSLHPEYIEKLSQWVELDNIIDIRKNKLKFYVAQKIKLEKDIIKFIENNNMKNTKIHVDNNDVMVVEKKQKQGITLRTLKEILKKYFNEHKYTNETSIYNFIVNNRETKTNLYIKRRVSTQNIIAS